MTLKARINDYYTLTKPGIIRGNVIVASAGFFLASKSHIRWLLLLAVITGTSSIIAAACIFNNYRDRDIDQLMSRTKKRVLVTGSVSTQSALILASILLVVGVTILAVFTNKLALAFGLLGFLVYVFLYTPYKRKSLYGTHIGSISGAVPPVAGYVAVTNRLDAAAIILFFMLVFWQLGHFFSIAIYRLSDYKKARIPVLPIVRGVGNAQASIIAYVIAYGVTASLLTALHYTGHVYLVCMVGISAIWATLGIRGLKSKDNVLWARQMFLYSLIVISLQSLLLSLTGLLP